MMLPRELPRELPCLVFSLRDARKGSKVKLIRSANATPAVVRTARAAAQIAQTYSDAEDVGRAIKSHLDHYARRDGRFLLDYGEDLFAELNDHFVTEIAKTASFVGDRRRQPRLVRRGGAVYFRMHSAYSTILIEFSGQKTRRMTVLSVDGVPFACDEAFSWQPDKDWEPSQGAIALEWQGETPAYFTDAIRSQVNASRLEASLEQLFWDAFSPSLEDPFVKDNREDMRFLVQADEIVTMSHGRGMILEEDRREPFVEIVGDLIRALAPDRTERERDFVLFDMAWEKRTRKTTRRRPATLDDVSFELPAGIPLLLNELVRWLKPAGARYRNLLGVRASTGILGPMHILFEGPSSPLSAHERLEAAGRAAGKLAAIGFDPARYGL